MLVPLVVAITAVAVEIANATGIGELADITLRGAEVLGAVSGGITVVQPGEQRRMQVERREGEIG